MKNIAVQTCISLCSKQFCIITFFSYFVKFNWKMEFRVLTYCNFPNFSLIEKCYWDNY